MSVVIPTHQRRELVLRLLRSLAAQDLERDTFEVIVVADGCSDGTAAAISGASWPFPLRVIEQPQSGQGAGRNRGVQEAVGEGVIFLDDDVVVPPDFVRRVRESLRDGADLVVPFVRVPDSVPDGLLAREQRRWDEEVLRGMQGPLDEWSVDYLHFMATGVSRRALDELGGFDPAYTAGGAWGKEDTELAYRFIRAGRRIVCRPELVIESDCVVDPVVSLRRARDVGRSDVRFVRKYPEFAPAIFGRLVTGSRIQRAVAAAVLTSPSIAALLAPLRTPVFSGMRRGWAGGWLYRFWLLIWAGEYWAGVAEAGGAGVARKAFRPNVLRADAR